MLRSLEDMEREARDFGGTRTFTVGQQVVQIISTLDPYSKNYDVQYRIGGWPVPRTHVIRALAGEPPERVPSYAELLAEGGLKVGPVTSGG